MKKRSAFILSLIMVVSVFAGLFGNGFSVAAETVKTYKDFIGSQYRAGIQTGEVYDVVAENALGTTNVSYYSNFASALTAVEQDKLDYVLYASDIIHTLTDEGMYDTLTFEALPADIYEVPCSQVIGTPELAVSYNAFIDSIIESGELPEIVNFWQSGQLPSEEAIDARMAEILVHNKSPNGTLTFAGTIDYAPMSYYNSKNELVGLDIELMNRFASFMGMTPKYSDMDYGAIITAVASGKADLSACCIAMSDEREESVVFGKPWRSVYCAIAYKGGAEKGVVKPSVYGLMNTSGDYTIYGQSFDETAGNAENLDSAVNEANSSGADSTDNTDSVAAADERWKNYVGKRYAMKVGSVFEPIIDGVLDASEKLYFADNTGNLEALKTGKADASIFDSSAAPIFLEDYPELTMIVMSPEFFTSPMGYPTMNEEIRLEFNEFLKVAEADGTLADMQKRWLNPDDLPDLDSPMPEIDLSDHSNGKVTAAITGVNPPFDFTGANGVYKGYDVELLQRYASWAKRELELVTMDFGVIINYVASGKADLGASGISITDERKKSVNFTDPTYVDTASILVRKSDFGETTDGQTGTADSQTGDAAASDSTASAAEGGNALMIAIQRNLITDNRYKLILSGLLTTMIISVCSMLIGTALGSGVAWLLTRKNKFAEKASRLVCGLISGLPTVTLLMVAYYIIFGKVDISSTIIAIAAFSVVMGIRVGETLTEAIRTVDPVEIEAARASGFTATGAFFTVTLPQAVKIALQPYLSHFVSLVKETAIVGYVAIQDLMRASDIIRSRTYDAYFPLLFAALIYLIVTTIFILLFKLLVKKITAKNVRV
jgi:polar amino acid transport system substrate-binding protein